MKKAIIKFCRFYINTDRSVLLLYIFLLIPHLPGNAQTRLNTIDGVYIERTYYPVATSDIVSDKKIPVIEPFLISETNIVNGDVIAFDIPGLNDYLRENKKLLKNITLIIKQLELPEFPAYIENAESDVVRFRFSNRDLNQDDRIKLYKLPGKSVKEVLLGLKIDESTVLNFNEPAHIRFKEIEKWKTFGWILIGAFFMFFVLLIFRYKSVIKDSVAHITDNKDVKTYFSFSKSQFAFWTFIVIASFIYIWAFTGDLNSINSTALILLGITSVTITASNLISRSEEERAEPGEKMQKLLNYRTKGPGVKSNFLQDILSDANGISIHRLQALVFNLVFGIAFFQSVIYNYSMPEFSEIQLILLGLSNGTYTFLKNSELNLK